LALPNSAHCAFKAIVPERVNRNQSGLVLLIGAAKLAINLI